MTTKNQRIVICLALAAALTLCAARAQAHGQPHPKPTAEERAKIAPALAGSAEFAAALAARSGALFSNDQLATLAEVSRLFADAHEVREHVATSGEDPVDAEYCRWLGERKLLELLGASKGALTYDFRHGEPATDLNLYHEVPAQSAWLLLKVITGDGPAAFTVHEQDVAHVTEPVASIVTPVVRGGTSWVLLNLKDIPSGKSIFHLAFQNQGEAKPGWFDALLIEARRSGQLNVEVLDEHGQPTPALIRLTEQATGTLWGPPNAVDYAPIMDAIAGAGLKGPARAFPYYTPGPFKGWYWVTPGPFQMPLPPGRWEIRVHHGVEHAPRCESFEIKAGELTHRTYTMKRWTNMAERGWFSGDDHVHAQMMNDDDARKIMTFSQATDTHLLNILEMGNQMRTWYSQRGFGPDYRVREKDWILVPGQEDPRFRMGHAIGLNTRSLVRDLHKYMLNDWVADEIHKQGGLYGHTHVGHKAFNIQRDMTLLIPREKSDFNSILQGFMGTDLYYDFLDLGYKLTASAGSDTPYGGAPGVVRVYCQLPKGQPFSADAWFKALGQGHTFVSNGPMVEFSVEGVGPGGELELKDDRPLKVHARAWGLAGGSAPARVQLIQFGKPIQQATNSNAQQGELALECTVAVGYGSWLAVHVYGHDGSEAHTTPVYVTRKGFRHWNAARADALITERLKTLDEIEQELVGLEEQQRQGKIWSRDYWVKWALEQAPQVRERTRLVRGLYEDLRQTLARELELRKAGQQ